MSAQSEAAQWRKFTGEDPDLSGDDASLLTLSHLSQSDIMGWIRAQSGTDLRRISSVITWHRHKNQTDKRCELRSKVSLCTQTCVLLRAPLVFLTSDSQIRYVSAQMLWAGSSYLPYEVKGSVSNIHGCETIKSWCDNRGGINAETEPYSNINLHTHTPTGRNAPHKKLVK